MILPYLPCARQNSLKALHLKLVGVGLGEELERHVRADTLFEGYGLGESPLILEKVHLTLQKDIYLQKDQESLQLTRHLCRSTLGMKFK